MKTLNEHRESFLEWLQVRSYSLATIKARGHSLGTLFRFLTSKEVFDVREVTPGLVREYPVWLAEGSRYAMWSRVLKIRSARLFFAYLAKREVIFIDPCEGLILPEREERLPRTVLSESEARAILAAPDAQSFKGIRDRAMLELFYSTGIRREEMLHLQVCDVDCGDGFLRVNLGKGAKDRVVPFGGKAAHCLSEYIREVRIHLVRTNPSERALWLSTLRPHQPLSNSALPVIVRDYAEAAGCGKRVTPHVWRHTCATHLVAGGVNIAFAQQLLGHRRIDTTQRYVRVAIPEVLATFNERHPRAKESAAAADPAKVTRMKGKYR